MDSHSPGGAPTESAFARGLLLTRYYNECDVSENGRLLATGRVAAVFRRRMRHGLKEAFDLCQRASVLFGINGDLIDLLFNVVHTFRQSCHLGGQSPDLARMALYVGIEVSAKKRHEAEEQRKERGVSLQ